MKHSLKRECVCRCLGIRCCFSSRHASSPCRLRVWPDSDRFIGPQKPYFSSKKFSEDLLSNIEYLYNLETPLPILEIRPFGNSDYSYITNLHLEVATGEREKLEKLLPILKQLQNDTKLHSLVKEIIELRKSLENTALKRFNDLRTQLFSDLSLGQKNLRGRCDYCP